LTTPEHCFLSKQDESHLSQQSKIIMTNCAGQFVERTVQNEDFGPVACITVFH